VLLLEKQNAGGAPPASFQISSLSCASNRSCHRQRTIQFEREFRPAGSVAERCLLSQ
jgi:hypothetical protein